MRPALPRRRHVVAIAVPVMLLVSACGGSSSHPAAPATSGARRTTTVPTFGGVPGAAQRVACSANVRALQQASDVYKAMHAAPAPSLDALMAAQGLTRTTGPNDGYTITYDARTGAVAATGACSGA